MTLQLLYNCYYSVTVIAVLQLYLTRLVITFLFAQCHVMKH